MPTRAQPPNPIISPAVAAAATFTRKQIAELLNVSTETIGAWTRQGKIPPPIRLSCRKLLWRLETVLAFLQQQEGAANATQAS